MSEARRVTREEFRSYFAKALRAGAERSAKRFDLPLPTEFSVELHGAGNAGTQLTESAAADALYIDSSSFYKIIDVAIVQVSGNRAVAFVRAAAFAPCPWEATFDPAGLGPFAPTLSDDIKESRVRRMFRRLVGRH